MEDKNKVELEQTDLEDVYIIRYDGQTEYELDCMAAQLRKQMNNNKAIFILAHKDSTLNVINIVNDKKVIIEEYNEQV